MTSGKASESGWVEPGSNIENVIGIAPTWQSDQQKEVAELGKYKDLKYYTSLAEQAETPCDDIYAGGVCGEVIDESLEALGKTEELGLITYPDTDEEDNAPAEEAQTAPTDAPTEVASETAPVEAEQKSEAVEVSEEVAETAPTEVEAVVEETAPVQEVVETEAVETSGEPEAVEAPVEAKVVEEEGNSFGDIVQGIRDEINEALGNGKGDEEDKAALTPNEPGLFVQDETRPAPVETTPEVDATPATTETTTDSTPEPINLSEFASGEMPQTPEDWTTQPEDVTTFSPVGFSDNTDIITNLESCKNEYAWQSFLLNSSPEEAQQHYHNIA